MTTDAKPREFWIAIAYENSMTAHDTESEALDNAWMNAKDNTIHVIEHSAYAALAAKLAIAVEALKIYDDEAMGFSIGDTVQYPDEIEYLSGRWAREALAKIGGAE